MSDAASGLVTAEVNGWTVTTNSGGSEAKLRENLKGKPSEEVSKAGSELGKLGGKAAAEKRAAEKSDLKVEQSEPDENTEAEEAPEPKQAKPETEAEPEEKPEEKKPNPRHDPKARMLEATRKEAEAKRALAAEREAKQALESRLAALEQRLSPPPAETKPQAWDGQSKPKLEDFVREADTYEAGLEAYQEARDTWRDGESKRKYEAEAVEKALDSQVGKFREAASAHMGRYSEAVLSLKTEFQLAPNETASGSNWLANELVFSPGSAPALMLYLSEHDDELQRIAALPNPRAVSREMAKLETRLEAASAGTNSSRSDDVSRAAPPVKPVAGKPYVTESDEYRPGMSLDEYARIWRKQNRSK